jgi:hypothetical protein
MREMNVSRYTMTTRPRKRVVRMLRPRRMRTRPRLGRDNDQHVRVTFPSGDTEIQSRTIRLGMRSQRATAAPSRCSPAEAIQGR